MLKQASFSDPTLKTPEIYKSGNQSGLFFFDMEFIGGAPLHNFITLNTIDNISPLVEKILLYLKNIPTEKKDITKNIEKKVDSLQKIVPSTMTKYCNFCLDYDWTSIPLCSSHGDLTFENMLVYRNKIYLIDFLDSFIETKYVDYSKLFQDVLLMWSWRNDSCTPFIKNIYLYNKIIDNLSQNELETIKRLLVLGLLRIVPYSDKNVLKFLENRLQYISKKFGI